MRSSDEDQHGSTRPNLLSGARRRFGGDDNILERLERDSARHASGNRGRAARYAAGASLVLLVIVVVAWMAFENASSVQVIPMQRAQPDGVAAAVAPPVHAPAEPAPPPAPAMHDTSDAAASSAPVHARNDAIAALPPLVMLEEQKAAPKISAPEERAAVSVATAPVKHAKPVEQAAAARPVPRAAVAARARKPATVTPAVDAPVDTDVALLSAIIIHDSTHAAERAQMEAATICARSVERRCPGRPGGGP